MNRPYQFYYFVPLVSFWFVFIYVTMTVWPRITTTSVDSKSSWRVSLTECQRKARHAPVMSDEVLAWLSVCSELQVICIWWSIWCHCHPIIPCIIKIQIGLTFLVPAYGGCPRKRRLNRCPSDCYVLARSAPELGCSSHCQGPLSLYVDMLQSVWPMASVIPDLRLPSEQENTATVPLPYTHFP